MKASVTLGRPFGITIGAHWSLFAFGLLAAWSLASGFETGLPGYGTATYWAVGVAVVVLFFGGLIIHELAHALVARRHGLEVETITLWILGGMAMLSKDPDTAKAEFQIAAAGPLASLGVALLTFGGAAAVAALTDARVLISGLVWLAIATAVLAVFNLLPARPMDGGRILTALVWMRTKDQTRATMAAAQVSTVVGWLLVAAGAWLLFAFGAFSGVWFALIGWIVVTASTADRRLALWRTALRGLRFRDVMGPPPPSIPAAMTVRDLVLGQASAARVPLHVVKGAGGAIVGVLSTFDASRAAFTRPDTPVGDLAKPLDASGVAGPDDDVSEALSGGALRLPVLVQAGDGSVVGQVGPDELSRWAADHHVTGGTAPGGAWPANHASGVSHHHPSSGHLGQYGYPHRLPPGTPLPPPRPEDRLPS